MFPPDRAIDLPGKQDQWIDRPNYHLDLAIQSPPGRVHIEVRDLDNGRSWVL